MSDFIFVNCPNCKIKVKLDKTKKYHDCPDCKHEFRLDDVEGQLSNSENNDQGKSESIFAKFMKEKDLT